MIVVVTTSAHRYTHSSLVSATDLDLHVIGYDEILGKSSLPRATYIFTDFDRMAPWALEKAASVYRELKKAGVRVLNDPAANLSRYGLLRRLRRAGFNDFDAYRVEERVSPSRWPVFLRSDGDHSGAVSGLLENEEDLGSAIEACIAAGKPAKNLLIVEYVGEPALPGIFQKLSVFRVAGSVLGYTSVTDDDWQVKQGKPLGPPDLYEREYENLRDAKYAELMQPVFDIGCVDYGRVDFAFWRGRPQVFEINTNPHVKLKPKQSTMPFRNESNALFRKLYLDALRQIDSH